MTDNTDWREVRSQRELNEDRVQTHRFLMHAATQIAELRASRGVGPAQINEASYVADRDISPAEEETEIYLSTLARYVAALGGHIEVQAVFPEERVTVLSTDVLSRLSGR